MFKPCKTCRNKTKCRAAGKCIKRVKKAGY